MKIRSSLKRKSMIALAAYVLFVITLVGTISYKVVEPPVRSKLERNLDLSTQLISNQIQSPLNSSLGVLQSIVSVGSTGIPQKEQAVMLHSLFSVLNGIAVSGVFGQNRIPSTQMSNTLACFTTERLMEQSIKLTLGTIQKQAAITSKIGMCLLLINQWEQ